MLHSGREALPGHRGCRVDSCASDTQTGSWAVLTMLRGQVLRLVVRSRSVRSDPLAHPFLFPSTQQLGTAHAYSGVRSPEGQSVDASQSSEESLGATDRLAGTRDAHGDGQLRPPLPGDGNHIASSAGHWMDRRLPGARRWLQDKSLEWWLRGVQARCKCAASVSDKGHHPSSSIALCLVMLLKAPACSSPQQPAHQRCLA